MTFGAPEEGKKTGAKGTHEERNDPHGALLSQGLSRFPLLLLHFPSQIPIQHLFRDLRLMRRGKELEAVKKREKQAGKQEEIQAKENMDMALVCGDTNACQDKPATTQKTPEGTESTTSDGWIQKVQLVTRQCPSRAVSLQMVVPQA